MCGELDTREVRGCLAGRSRVRSRAPSAASVWLTCALEGHRAELGQESAERVCDALLFWARAIACQVDGSGSRGVSRLIEVGGGYDRGYSQCPMFWPDTPGSVLLALKELGQLRGEAALDVGCGEGANAAWLAGLGFAVEAVEVSRFALKHAMDKYRQLDVDWIQGDARTVEPRLSCYDLVNAYGLLHCINDHDLDSMLGRLMEWTAPGGLLVVVAFNDRSQDLDRAHAGFHPTLRTHASYLEAFEKWELLIATDSDLHETHPDTNIAHHHSMTRIAARHP